MTAGDVLAAHINQFFQLDDERQKIMLASLSAYAGNSNQGDVIAPVTGGKRGSEHAADVPMFPATVSKDANGAISSSKIFSAKPVPLEPMKVMIGGPSSTLLTPASPMLPQGPSGDPWHKVVQQLGGNLPKGTAILMQDLLSQASAWDSKSWSQQTPQTTGPKAQERNDKMAAVRWLTQQLEKQQEESVQKLRNIMAHSCSGDGPAGINLPVQSSCSLPHVQEPVQGSLLTRSKGKLGGAAPNGQSFFNAMQPHTPSRGVYTGGSATEFGAALLPEAASHQQLAAAVLNGRLKQNVRNSGVKSEKCLRYSGQAGAAASVGETDMRHDTLRMQLRSLIHVNSDRVLIVRKINRLGFASQAVLLKHFSWYGVVERVLVAHSRVKSGRAPPGSLRMRPSGLGFVVMSKVEEAQTILAQGKEHLVNGIFVNISKFERRMTAHEADSKGEESVAVTPETSLSEENCSSMINSSSGEESN